MFSHKLSILAITYFLCLASCSEIPPENEIKTLVQDYEKDKLLTPRKASLISPCFPAETFEIPKAFKNYYSTKDNGIVEASIKAKEILKDISLAGFVTIVKTLDKSGYYEGMGQMIAEEYSVNTTSKGQEFLVGESGDAIVFKFYDLTDLKILSTYKISTDTLNVTYKLNSTPIYNILKKHCPNRGGFVSDTLNAKLIHNGDTWNILKRTD